MKISGYLQPKEPGLNRKFEVLSLVGKIRVWITMFRFWSLILEGIGPGSCFGGFGRCSRSIIYVISSVCVWLTMSRDSSRQ